MTYRLINSRPSPYGRKVAIALLEKNLAFTVEYDEPWGENSCTGSYSPLRQLPILITPDGKYIYDSTYILEWLEIVHPSPPLLPVDRDDRLTALKLKMLGERLMEVAQSLIFEQHRPDPSEAWIVRQSQKIEGGLAEVDSLLDERLPRPEQPIHLGHIALATTCLVWEFAVAEGLSPDTPEFRWRGRYPKLTHLLEALAQRPSFTTTEPGMMNVDITAHMS